MMPLVEKQVPLLLTPILDPLRILSTSPFHTRRKRAPYIGIYFSSKQISSWLLLRSFRRFPVPQREREMAPGLKLLDCSLRVSAVPLSVATIWLTVANKQDNSIYGDLEYSNLMGLKYMVLISAICAGYSFLAAITSWMRCFVVKAWLFFVSDQIIAYLMITSWAAVLEILYLAYNGDREVTWSEACTSYGKFCYRMKLAMIFHAFALVCFIILAVISAYRVFRVFEPPLLSSEDVEEDTA